MALKIKIASLFMSMFVIVSLIREPIQQTEIQVVKEVIQSSTKLTSVDLDVFNGILLKFPGADKEVVEKAMTGKVYSDFPDRLDILTVVSNESGFRRCPTDGSGSFGPMQVNIRYHEMDPALVCDPELNIHEGTKILRTYFRLLGSERAAILAYNAGPGNYRKGNYNEGYYEKFLRVRNSLRRL